MFKGTRVIDPKLRIRPFKSRVTFSEDTKKGDKQEVEKLVYFIPKSNMDNSNTELYNTNDIMDIHPDSLKASLTDNRLYPTTHLMVEIPTEAMADKKAELVLRRQSLDPSLIIEAGAQSQEQPDKWLHHQSLPNIQEGQEGEDTINSEMLVIQTSPSIGRKVSVRRHTSDRTTERRRSFRRQRESQEPEMIEPTEEEIIVAIIEDHQKSVAAAEAAEVPQNSCAPTEADKFLNDMPFKKKRKENAAQPKIRQSSTESDTGSYHTANSFLMQISEDREDLPEFLNTSTSSMDSYTSAVDENDKSPTDTKTVPMITLTEATPSSSSLATENGSPDQKEKEQKSKFFPIRHSSKRKSSTEDNT